jgi:hypothetical protein
MSERINDSKRFDSIIDKYNAIYSTLTHTELADEILEGELKMKRPLDISHRTLRRYVGDFRDRLEKKASLKDYPLTPNDCFMPSGFKGEDMYIPDPNQRTLDFDSPKSIMDCGGLGIQEYNIPNVKKADMPIFPIEEIKQRLSELRQKESATKNIWVVGGCMHLPFHNKKLVMAFVKLLRYLKDKGVLKGTVLAGDIVDNHSISRHAKGKITLPGYDLSREYNEANLVLDVIDDAIGDDVEKVFFYGNHEDWYYEYMSNVDNIKLGGDVVKSPEEALRLKARGYTVHNKYKKAKHIIGDLEVIHGVFINKHAAHEHVQKMKRNVMFVHTHRMGSYIEGIFEGYNIGWMGDKDHSVFSYMSDIQKENWANGFAVVTVDADNKAHVQQIMWKNNCFYYDGIKFQ